MKKSTLLIILLIYVASIFAINFFGMQIISYNKTSYITNIECRNNKADYPNVLKFTDCRDTKTEYDNADFKVVINSNRSNKYTIEVKITPEDPTDSTLIFSIDDDSVATLSVNKHSATVTFNSTDIETINVTIIAADSNSVKCVIEITAIPL